MCRALAPMGLESNFLCIASRPLSTVSIVLTASCRQNADVEVKPELYNFYLITITGHLL
jgi:hypothetical protein